MAEEQTTPPNDEFKIKLDDLGPIIVNTDGTLGRIPNWSEMPQAEKDKTARLISARNKKRLQALREVKPDNKNLLDSITTEGNAGSLEGNVDAEVDPMKGSGSGSAVKSMTLTIEHS